MGIIIWTMTKTPALQRAGDNYYFITRVRDWYLNHLNTIKKWHVQQESIQIAESITPTAHLMNSSPNRSINIFQIKTNQGLVT